MVRTKILQCLVMVAANDNLGFVGQRPKPLCKCFEGLQPLPPSLQALIDHQNVATVQQHIPWRHVQVVQGAVCVRDAHHSGRGAWESKQQGVS